MYSLPGRISHPVPVAELGLRITPDTVTIAFVTIGLQVRQQSYLSEIL